jgi:hypothetical protein
LYVPSTKETAQTIDVLSNKQYVMIYFRYVVGRWLVVLRMFLLLPAYKNELIISPRPCILHEAHTGVRRAESLLPC